MEHARDDEIDRSDQDWNDEYSSLEQAFVGV